jgi:mono/diheme cytochrome c family protein
MPVELAWRPRSETRNASSSSSGDRTVRKAVLAFILGSIALPLLIVLVALLGWMPSDSTSTPPKFEVAVGLRALDASLEKRSAGLRNPIAANDAAAVAAGGRLYAKNCAGCHGDAKAPSEWGRKGFYPRVPQFFQDGTEVGPEEAYAAIHDGIRYSGMGAWRDLMKDDEMWKVANFVSRIHDRPSNLRPNAAR